MRTLAYFLLLLVAGCGEQIIEVTVVGLRGDAQALLAQVVTPAGKRLSQDPVPRTAPRFNLSLSGPADGAYRVEVSSRDGRDCQLQGGAEVVNMMGPGTYPVTVTLNDAPGCGLLLQPERDLMSGAGRVLIEGRPELSCEGAKDCFFAMQKGDKITLRAEAATGSYFPGWFDPRHGAELEIGPEPLVVPFAFLNRQRCYKSGFCWISGGPNLFGAWGAGGDDLWMVGPGGTLQRRLGDTLVPVPVPVSEATLLAVWGQSANDVWVAGAGVVLHGEGPKGARSLSFQVVPLPALTPGPISISAIVGRGPHDVLFVGANGLVLRWDGAALRLVDSGVSTPLSAVAVDKGGYWVVGDRGVVLRGDGASFQRVDAGITDNLYSVYSSGEEVYLGGGLPATPGTLWRGSGGRFAAVPQQFPFTVQSLLGGDGELWAASGAVVYRRVGVDFVRVDARDYREDAVTLAGPPRAPFTVGFGGAVRRWNGSAFSEDQVGDLQLLDALWAGSKDDVWIGGLGGAPLHWDGRNLLALPQVTGQIREIEGDGKVVQTYGGNEDVTIDPVQVKFFGLPVPYFATHAVHRTPRWLYRAGVRSNFAVLFKQSAVGEIPQFLYADAAGDSTFQSVYGSDDDLWAVGYGFDPTTVPPARTGGVAVHRTAQGGATKVLVPGPLNTVTGDGSGTVWVGGDGGVLMRWDGSKFQDDNRGLVANTNVYTIYIDPTGQRWVGDTLGVARYSEEVGWVRVLPAGVASITRLLRVDDDLWAVGVSGAVLRLSGVR